MLPAAWAALAFATYARTPFTVASWPTTSSNVRGLYAVVKSVTLLPSTCALSGLLVVVFFAAITLLTSFCTSGCVYGRLREVAPHSAGAQMLGGNIFANKRIRVKRVIVQHVRLATQLIILEHEVHTALARPILQQDHSGRRDKPRALAHDNL